MSSAFSDHLEYLVLRQTMKMTADIAITATAIWVGLHQTNLSDTAGTSGSEVATTGGYARLASTAADWTVNTAGTIQAKNNLALTFGVNSSGSAYTVTDVGIWRHSSNILSSDLMFRGTLSAAVTVNLNDTFQFATSALTITVS